MGWRLRVWGCMNSIILLVSITTLLEALRLRFLTSARHSAQRVILAMCFDSHLLAHVENGTGRAVGEIACADVFPKGNEKPVDLDPVAPGECFAERYHRFFRR